MAFYDSFTPTISARLYRERTSRRMTEIECKLFGDGFMGADRQLLQRKNAAVNRVGVPANRFAVAVLLVCFSGLMLSFATAADLQLNRATRHLPATSTRNPASDPCQVPVCIRDCRRNGGPLVSVCESLCVETCRSR